MSDEPAESTADEPEDDAKPGTGEKSADPAATAESGSATPDAAEPMRSDPGLGESAGTGSASVEADEPRRADSGTAPSAFASPSADSPEPAVRTAVDGSATVGGSETTAEQGKAVSMKKLLAGRKTGGSAGAPEQAGSGVRPRVLSGALAMAVLLLIGAIGVAGYLYVQERDKAELLAAYDEVQRAACRYAPVLANYDAKNLEPYFSAVLDGATGDWKKEFETTTGELREALVAGEVVSTAGDIQCAVKTADTTSAQVVVVIGQTITSLGTQGRPAPGQLAMVMRMQKTDGRWLVDQMTSPLTAPRQ
ncbi:hypothetical protein IU448_27630 [Nocardia flavorosea]|uniref:hypothetical protein n=1 Tax=Nocardia flavorosea TaxID=53429 RepID=UPI0018942F01|nr:hypothetical protein [Nocardia flavorosea]MBF6352751.1 hypothetical protein [Nocardia flavorosea]